MPTPFVVNTLVASGITLNSAGDNAIFTPGNISGLNLTLTGSFACNGITLNLGATGNIYAPGSITGASLVLSGSITGATTISASGRIDSSSVVTGSVLATSSYGLIAANTNQVLIGVSSGSGAYTMILPTNTGSAGQALVTSGGANAITSWASFPALPLSIANGGLGNTSFLTAANQVPYYNGSSFVAGAVSTISNAGSIVQWGVGGTLTAGAQAFTYSENIDTPTIIKLGSGGSFFTPTYTAQECVWVSIGKLVTVQVHILATIASDYGGYLGVRLGTTIPFLYQQNAGSGVPGTAGHTLMADGCNITGLAQPVYAILYPALYTGYPGGGGGTIADGKTLFFTNASNSPLVCANGMTFNLSMSFSYIRA